ncbi:MFS transporter [Bifidobacterium sp. LC6]|uniref:MFS transporter n=1 Tax=Bifidobacterium colobi TaxID=2809026 RepID=A0ABS5UVD6_9BIFI|nr:MFS transporter [Bifidobacterium colobi]MBT1175042.1 MFS transporter [Bifidobacterium colobi]
MSQESTAAAVQPAQASGPLSKMDKTRFCVAFFIFSFCWMLALQVVAAVLLPQRLSIIAPDSKDAIFGVLNSATALASLISNLVVGNMSDRTRSIFGRRTPWIAAGGILAGVTLFLIGFLPDGVSIGVSYCLAMVGLNMMIAPVVASLSDRVPESLRGTMSAFISAGTLFGSALGQIVGAQFITMMMPGFIVSGIVMALSGVLTVIFWPREASSKDMPKQKADFKSILVSFKPPVKDSRDFWLAFVGRSLLLFSYYMILNYQLYILQDFIGLDDKSAGSTLSIMSVVLMVVSLVSALSAGPISDKIGRRKVPVVAASLLLAVGYAMPWLLHNAMGMILFSAIGGFGYGMYGSVDQALNVDVLPNEEEAGKDLGILNIATTLGQMVGPIVTSSIVVATKSYALVFPTAIALAVVGCVFIMLIKKVK